LEIQLKTEKEASFQHYSMLGPVPVRAFPLLSSTLAFKNQLHLAVNLDRTGWLANQVTGQTQVQWWRTERSRRWMGGEAGPWGSLDIET
jgi:hypothetical protein